MPALRNRNKFSATDVVEAVQSHAVQLPKLGYPLVVREGERFAGDHEAVQLNPDYFVVAGAPHEQIAEQRRELSARDELPTAEQQVTKIVPPLRDEEAVVPCGLVIGVPEGKRMRKDDPAVREQRDSFVPVVGEGRTRDNSYVALRTINAADAAGHVRTVWAGTWIDRDDPLVRLHPHSFTLPDVQLVS